MLQFSGEWPLIDELRAEGIPLVVISCWEQGSDCVAVDDAAGERLAVEHLLELGHRRIAYLSSGLVESQTDDARFEGYRSALQAARIPVSDDLVVRWEEPAYLSSDREILHATERLLAGPETPTAFVVSNDLVAIDLVETLEQMGIAVPKEISVIGFDDIALAGLARVSLTTVAQPREALAELGSSIMLDRIQSGALDPLRQVRLDPKLVVRASTAPVAG
jgi:LacI family transcriptional regulator